MIVHFATTKGWLSRVIRTLTLSRWSHVALQIGPSVFEATMKDGVTVGSLYEFRERYPVSTQLIVGGEEHLAATWLRNRVGADYDYSALLAFAVNRNWEDDEKWFCSELVTQALIKAGAIHPKIKSHRITPRDLWLLLTYGDYDHD